MTQNEKGPTSAPTLNRASSINPTKDQKMNEQRYNTDASAAPALTRRKMIAAIAAAGSVATLPAVALAEGSRKTSRLPPHEVPKEHPWDKARRLADELSRTLDECDDGRWFATIYPANSHHYAIMFGDIRSEHRARNEVCSALLQLIKAHEDAHGAFSVACETTDVVALGREPTRSEWRRYRSALRREDEAFSNVISYIPMNGASLAAKAVYLRRFAAHSQLNEGQVDRLLISMCGRYAV